MINRIIKQKVINVLEDGMVAIIYGARQVGKTTLAKNIATSYKNPLYINCDDPLVAINIINKSALELKAYIGNSDLVIFDEAQRIENIGITLKLLHEIGRAHV